MSYKLYTVYYSSTWLAWHPIFKEFIGNYIFKIIQLWFIMKYKSLTIFFTLLCAPIRYTYNQVYVRLFAIIQLADSKFWVLVFKILTSLDMHILTDFDCTFQDFPSVQYYSPSFSQAMRSCLINQYCRMMQDNTTKFSQCSGAY